MCFKRQDYGTKSSLSRLRTQVLEGKCASFGALCEAEPGGGAVPVAGLVQGTDCPACKPFISGAVLIVKIEFLKLPLQVLWSAVAT